MLPSFLFLIKGVWCLSFPFYSLHVLGAAVFPPRFALTGASLSPFTPRGFLRHGSPAPTLWGSCASISPISPLEPDPTPARRPQDGARSLAPPPDVTALPSLLQASGGVDEKLEEEHPPGGLRRRTLSARGPTREGTSLKDWLGTAADPDAPYYWPKAQRRERRLVKRQEPDGR